MGAADASGGEEAMGEAQRQDRIGFIGLGSMGLGMARSLLGKGFAVRGFDVRRQAVEALREAGGDAASSPAEAAEGTAILVVMVVNASQAETVLFGKAGAVEALPAGAVVMLSSTVPASFAAATAARLEQTGHLMLDAPVSGGAAGAAAGTLTVMASGPADAFAKAEDVLAAMAGKVYRLGERPGIGSTVKTVNQLL